MRYSTHSTKMETQISTWSLWASNNPKPIEIIVLEGVIDLDYQGETGLLVYNRGNQDYVWSAVDLFRHLLVLLCPMIKVSGKLQQINPGRMTKYSDFLAMKVWMIPPGKEARPAGSTC